MTWQPDRYEPEVSSPRGYRAGLPGSTRPAKGFAPLPRRTSPSPFDSAAQAAYWAKRQSVVYTEPFVRKTAGTHFRRPSLWQGRLQPLEVGEFVEVDVPARTARIAASTWGHHLGRKFTTQAILLVSGGMGARVMRVE